MANEDEGRPPEIDHFFLRKQMVRCLLKTVGPVLYRIYGEAFCFPYTVL